MALAVTDVGDLLELVGLTHSAVDLGADAEEAARNFRLRVPRAFVDCMAKGDPRDPLLRQVVPTNGEMQAVSGFNRDPVGEMSRGAADGLIHKYQGRALLVVTGVCAIHCRYCFRRHYPYGQHTVQGRGLEAAIGAIEEDRSITEVIFSGGDPLSLADQPLNDLCDAVEAIPHVRRLRWHTRTPIVMPSRVDNGLLDVIAGRSKPLAVVVHANHPQELSDDVQIACRALAGSGVSLLNQSVLLAGVNDDADVLVELSEKLFDCRVLPYYLHLLDRVAGAAHFEVGEDDATALMAEVLARLPGYLVPRLVREVDGASAKVLVGAKA
jgi:EF-P beta-lysylation protein EpmB